MKTLEILITPSTEVAGGFCKTLGGILGYIFGGGGGILNSATFLSNLGF
jgi:hypothetical protein